MDSYTYTVHTCVRANMHVLAFLLENPVVSIPGPGKCMNSLAILGHVLMLSTPDQSGALPAGVRKDSKRLQVVFKKNNRTKLRACKQTRRQTTP